MNTTAIINIAKQQLGLEEDAYRALLVRVTGRDSLRAMSERQRIDVVEEMKRRGFRVRSGGKSLPVSTRPYIRMIHALWKSCHRRGVISDGSRKALRAFVSARSPKEDPDLLTYDEASPIIEALKVMETRGK
ncbi:gp16 family protein [Martelella mediterranea]|uniref:Uncharacterized protein DUF1018 n=1 Tax=Martelella mediterranea TaxID=293089 RepID=A0A4R3NNS5_9HYPH|nr:regulatory protein GemA [Martelella mediterranea]TCT37446.1 uncharacterized protein DUF1018 [Martelella mediterranea]